MESAGAPPPAALALLKSRLPNRSNQWQSACAAAPAAVSARPLIKPKGLPNVFAPPTNGPPRRLPALPACASEEDSSPSEESARRALQFDVLTSPVDLAEPHISDEATRRMKDGRPPTSVGERRPPTSVGVRRHGLTSIAPSAINRPPNAGDVLGSGPTVALEKDARPNGPDVSVAPVPLPVTAAPGNQRHRASRRPQPILEDAPDLADERVLASSDNSRVVPPLPRISPGSAAVVALPSPPSVASLLGPPKAKEPPIAKATQPPMAKATEPPREKATEPPAASKPPKVSKAPIVTDPPRPSALEELRQRMREMEAQEAASKAATKQEKPTPAHESVPPPATKPQTANKPQAATQPPPVASKPPPAIEPPLANTEPPEAIKPPLEGTKPSLTASKPPAVASKPPAVASKPMPAAESSSRVLRSHPSHHAAIAVEVGATVLTASDAVTAAAEAVGTAASEHERASCAARDVVGPPADPSPARRPPRAITSAPSGTPGRREAAPRVVLVCGT